MEIKRAELAVPGCYSSQLRTFADSRGSFQKLFNAETFESLLPGFVPRECYLTTSANGVLRGMHFQLPPNDHAKIVICLRGSALDVIVDLRAGPGFGRATHVELSPECTNCVVMPAGVAHGFYAQNDDTQLLYFVESVHAPSSDSGVLWSSIPYEWPNQDPVLSERDPLHPELDAFIPPAEWCVSP